MKDSARTKQDDTSGPVERPTWRFSGRRGTPVHLREQAPQTLPPEIRKAVTQLARERAGESAPAGDARPVRAASELKLGRTDGQAPPVAAAPMPVERRSRREADPAVPTSHIPAATAPVAEPAVEQTVTLADAPAVEAVPDVPEIVAATPTDEVALSESETEPPAVVETPAAIETPELTEPTAEVEAPEVTPEPTAATPEATPSKAETPSKQTAARQKPSPAERRKLAKAKAKAKAKAQRAAKKDTDGGAASEKARRLFARGRDVDAEVAAAVEPADAAASSLAQPVTEDTPVEAPTPELVLEPTALAAAGAPAAESTVEPTATDDSPQLDASDLPDVIPSLDAIDEVEPRSFPTLEAAEATSISDVDLGTTEAPEAAPEVVAAIAEPVLATESAAQAAWELGRLPFLVHESTRTALEPMVSPDAVWDVVPSTISEPRPRTAPENVPVNSWEPDQVDAPAQPAPDWNEPTPIRASLQPIDWLPVGPEPTPAPIEPIDLPRRSAPDAIQRLDAPLEVPRIDHARASAREGMTPNARTAEARRRISRRRAELDELVGSLAGLGSGRRDA